MAVHQAEFLESGIENALDRGAVGIEEGLAAQPVPAPGVEEREHLAPPPVLRPELALKSMHQVSLGPAQSPKGCVEGVALRRMRLRGFASPCRFKMALMQLALGNPLPG